MNDYYSDIELEYNNFLAEQELYDNLISLGASVCNESCGLLLIQEDYKETVNKYIDKIATGIQKDFYVNDRDIINHIINYLQ